MALQDLTIMLSSHLGCPLSQKTPNMGNLGSKCLGSLLLFQIGVDTHGQQTPIWQSAKSAITIDLYTEQAAQTDTADQQ